MHAAIYQKYLFLALIYRFELSIIRKFTNPPSLAGFLMPKFSFTRRFRLV